MDTTTEVFWVRVCIQGPPNQISKAVRYAKENVSKSTEALAAVQSSVGIYNDDGERDRVTLYRLAEEPPLRITIDEEED